MELITVLEILTIGVMLVVAREWFKLQHEVQEALQKKLESW